jgi:hypothetical protein
VSGQAAAAALGADSTHTNHAAVNRGGGDDGGGGRGVPHDAMLDTRGSLSSLSGLGSNTCVVQPEQHFASFLQFNDRTRKPAVEVSSPLAESVVVLTCRTWNAASAVAVDATDTETSVGPRARTVDGAFEQEVAAIELLFSQFIRDIQLFN